MSINAIRSLTSVNRNNRIVRKGNPGNYMEMQDELTLIEASVE